MSFKLEFDTDNAAFDDHIQVEIPSILKHVAQMVTFGRKSGKVKDAKGNSIGSWELDHDLETDYES